MKSLPNLLRFLVRDFGPLFVFYFVNHYYGLRVAVVSAVIYSVAQVALLLIRREKISAFLKYSIATTLIFGALDLSLQTPVFFKYEASITNVITGIFFALTLWGEKTFIQEFAEQRLNRQGKTSPIRPEFILFYRYSTAVWTVYFFIKAGYFASVSSNHSVDEALVIRTAVGNVSFYAMLFTNIVLGKRIFDFFVARGLIQLQKA